jgi:hypothetical protein
VEGGGGGGVSSRTSRGVVSFCRKVEKK